MDPLLVLLLVVAIGLLIGRISIRGISFGTSAILFVALLAGHLGMQMPEGFGTFGLALFVYCVGISAGPTFFRGLVSRGRTMATLGGLIVATGLLVTWSCAKLLGLPADLAGGLMAGALTSTPALGAISEAVAEPTNVAVGFGVAYPVGIIAVVLFVQLALKLLGPANAPDSAGGQQPIEAAAETPAPERAGIQYLRVKIANPGIVGKHPRDVNAISKASCQVSRVQIAGRWRPTPPDYLFATGDRVMLVGELAELRRVAETLGVIDEGEQAVLDADRERKTVVVTSPNIYGHRLKDLHLHTGYGVTVSRIRRHELEFVPSARTQIEFGDVLTLVGEPAALATIEQVVGHRPRTLNETDLLSLAIGLTVGILCGNISLDLLGLSFSLGIAGGPLIVGLVLGHFRRIGPIRGSFPPAAQLLMTEGGLALFLADAGMRAGAAVGPVLATHGPVLVLTAAAIALIPLLVGFAAAKFFFDLTLLQTLGATCGGMTSTPGLAVLTGSTESSQPVTSYVAAYPVALVLITIIAPLLVELLG